MTNLYIPKKIKVGFQKRDDTFTGKLAYVIYYDEKGKLRKEDSWNGWRDQDIEVLEFDNTPSAGFIFNKGVQRYGYWGSGRSVIRVYDSRDFEFEISVDNLIGLLMHSDVSKRDIVEQCVFAWSGKDLVLLPVNSEEYQQSVKYTEKQSEKISAKDLVKGYTYSRKKSEGDLVYMGYFDWFNTDSEYINNIHTTFHKSRGKKHIFYNGSGFEPIGLPTISNAISELVVDNYASLMDEFFKTINSQKIENLTIKGKKIIKEKHHDFYQSNFYKIVEDRLIKIHLNSFSYNDAKDKNYIKIILDQADEFIINIHDNIMSLSKIEREYSSKYLYEKSVVLSPIVSKIYESMIQFIDEKAWIKNELTIEEKNDLMKQFDFGQLVAVLENGKKINFNK